MNNPHAKKISNIILAFILVCSFSAYGQSDIIKLKHKYYTSYFSQSEHIPLLVVYTLTSEMVICGVEDKVPREKSFTPDPELTEATRLNADYTRSGYDRGHNMSAQDNACNEQGMKECFYFSNMTPQPHSFNAGIWETLEKQERSEAVENKTIKVSIGSIGKAATIGADNVVVPRYMWKVIYIPSANTYECYIFPDTDGDTDTLDSYKTTINRIEEDADVSFANGTAVLN